MDEAKARVSAALNTERTPELEFGAIYTAKVSKYVGELEDIIKTTYLPSKFLKRSNFFQISKVIRN